MAVNHDSQTFKYNNMLVVSTEGYSAHSIKTLSIYTPNTWQQNRGHAEIEKNTKQGKLAELICQEIISCQKNLSFVPYDDFRSDDLKKVAPFDALIFRNDYTNAEQVNEVKREINNCIINELARSGHITVELKQKLNSQGIFLIEIKSSRLNKYERNCTNQVVTNDDADIQQIIRNINSKSDFIAYPYFARSSSSQIFTFQNYCELVKQQHSEKISPYRNNDEFIVNLKQKEINCASDIYTRIYIDDENNRAFISGYKLFFEFMEYPRIDRMLQKGKSESAIYYMTPIRGCRSLDTLEFDARLWK